VSAATEMRPGSWPESTRRNDRGELEIGGVSTVELAAAFGTPLYVFDETTLRARASSIRRAFAAVYERSRVVYAAKAYLSPAIVRVLRDEGLGLDVVSGGELFAGLLAGVEPEAIIFHGNNKSRLELEEAMTARVGLIAVDNAHEIALLDAVTRELGLDARVLLRLNPGVEPHTHHKMRTGAVDSKFGFPVWDGQADAAASAICATQRLRLVGYHAHVGSQIFDSELVAVTIGAMLAFAARVKRGLGIDPEVLAPGGGFGVADDASGHDVSITRWAAAAAAALRRDCELHDLAQPTLIVEPGRAIVGPAGVALYEVGARKSIPDVRTYVSVDGGMADNIRPALYGARYSAALANRDAAGEPVESVTIAGKYCESGDILIDSIALPPLEPGDLLAIPMAGAYCLAMASNYNLSPRPAAVLVDEGKGRLIRRRETYQEMLRMEVIEELADVATKQSACR
jgi:diaminopimelate decarboxylase